MKARIKATGKVVELIDKVGVMDYIRGKYIDMVKRANALIKELRKGKEEK